jgi:hypothetical protein
MPIKVHICAAVAVIVLALAPVASGQGSSVGAYGGQGGNLASNVAGGGAGAPVSPASSSESAALPFSGLDLVFLGGGGLLLMLAGALIAGAVGRTKPKAEVPVGGLGRLEPAEQLAARR